MFIELVSHYHYTGGVWTIRIENIFPYNAVTGTGVGGKLHCTNTNRKMAKGKLQNVPKHISSIRKAEGRFAL